jgi:hypothetical protein
VFCHIEKIPEMNAMGTTEANIDAIVRVEIHQINFNDFSEVLIDSRDLIMLQIDFP